MGITAFAEGCGGYADYALVREQSTINVPGAVGQPTLQALRRYGRHLVVGLASGATVSSLPPGESIVMMK